MPKVNYTISAPYQTDDLFDLVADIESYPLFLPWCSAARIIKKQNNVIIAELAIRYKFFFGTYTSKVTLIPKQEIIVELVDGPFKHLQNNWKFIPHQNESKIEFHLDFELKSKILDNFLQRDISQYTNIMLDSFLQRAEKIYLS